MDKKEQRKIVKEKLEKMTEDERISASDKIFDHLKNFDAYKSAKSVFCYLSTPNEADTMNIVRHAIKRGKSVYVPKTDGDLMSMVLIDVDTEFWFNQWGILEPKEGEPYKGEVDLAVIPLIGYDKELNRLGHGKGYYDRFLEDRKTYKLGLAFSCQELDSVATEEHDIKLDAIINENGVIL